MDKASFSKISEDELQQQLRLEIAIELFRSNQENYGNIDAPTKEGLVALAKLGKDVWNTWRTTYKEPKVDFDGFNFKDDPIDFSGFIFPSSGYLNDPCASFKGCTFGDYSKFMGARFEDYANFSQTKFGLFTEFSDTHFKREANFSKSYFAACSSFYRSEFGHRATFDESVFEESIIFKGATFKPGASFMKAEFLGRADFSAGTNVTGDSELNFFDSIYFNGTKFHGEAIFIDRAFKSTTDFGPLYPWHLAPTAEKQNFHYPLITTEFRKAPHFHGCQFHQDTCFDKANFLAPPSPKAARAYRTLKQAMEQLKATREEQKFFRLEMKAEHPSLPFGKRWISTIYSLFSDYGFSLWRPMTWLFTLSLLFGILYGVLANACASDANCAKIAWAANTGSTTDRTSAVIKYTLASVSPVPGLDRMQTELRPPLFGHHGWIPITALVLEILHKIVALVMAFLFALALRNLFKMKS
jgi:hypothetical protein